MAARSIPNGPTDADRESSSSRKRRAEDDNEDTISALRAKVRQLESERDFYQSRAVALQPSLNTSQMRTHEIDVDCAEFFHTSKYRSPPFEVDGIEFSVGIKEKVGYSLNRKDDEQAEVRVTPYITKTADDGPRSVLALITVQQRSLCRKSKTTAYCELSETVFMNKRMEHIGMEGWFEPSDDLVNSHITIRLSVVVQKLEMPGASADSKVVVVKGKEFFVSAGYLSQWSRYFRAYFEVEMEEKKSGRYPVKDDNISAEDFQEMLLVIYPTLKPISEDNFEALLKLANRFEMPDLTRRIEHFLIEFHNHSLNRAFVFSIAIDEYNLQLVQATLLHRWQDAELLEDELLNTNVYDALTPAAKNVVNQCYADSSIRRLNHSSRRECSYHDDDHDD